MIFHENRLLADDSHEISNLIFLIRKDVQNLSSAAVLIGALRVNLCMLCNFCMLSCCLRLFSIFSFSKKSFQENHKSAI